MSRARSRSPPSTSSCAKPASRNGNGRRRRRTSRSSPSSMRWPKSRSARPTRSAASRHAGMPTDEAYARTKAALKVEGVEFDDVKLDGLLFDIEVTCRAQPDPRRRAAHRRARHAHGAADRDPHRPAAARPRLSAVHARRDAGAGRGDARHRARRAAHRRAGRRVRGALHAPLQHAAVRHRRNRPRRQPEAARDRPRPAREARAGRGAAREGRVPVLDPRSLRNHSSATARRRWPRYAAAASR